MVAVAVEIVLVLVLVLVGAHLRARAPIVAVAVAGGGLQADRRAHAQQRVLALLRDQCVLLLSLWRPGDACGERGSQHFRSRVWQLREEKKDHF